MKSAFTVLAALALLPSLGFAEEADQVTETQSISPITQPTVPTERQEDAPIKVHTRSELQPKQYTLGFVASDSLAFLFAGPSMIQDADTVTCVVDCQNGSMISCTGQECTVYYDGSGCNAVDDGTTYEGSC